MISLSHIWLYPIKSCQPLAVRHAQVQPRGLEHDRRWLLVDADGRFITGRKLGKLVLLRAQPNADGGLSLSGPGLPALRVAIPDGKARRSVRVWKDQVDAASVAASVNASLSSWLGCSVALVHMDALAHRAADQLPGRASSEVSFADGFPLLLISQASLDLLNSKLPHAVPITRFRPNLLVTGCGAHDEDRWRRVRVGNVEFDLVKDCVRCVFTTVDPETGGRDPLGEPLKTLISYRRGAKGVTFGMNLIARGAGSIAVGDSLQLLE